MYYNRIIENEIIQSLRSFPVVAILGPRQSGKSTLAKHIAKYNYKHGNTLLLDLEIPSDLHKLDDAEWFFENNSEKLICIDEVQRKPEIFALLRAIVDKWGGNGHFLILGSASKDLIKQSSETLAGRISYHKLYPFVYEEIKSNYSLENYMVYGGFPRSLLSASGEVSLRWRENFIQTFIERDLLQWVNILPEAVRRLWQMLAHVNGQVINYSSLSNSLGISNVTVKNYIDLLAGTYMLEVINPYKSNLSKRVIKSPKVYISDTGLINAFLGIQTFNQLSGHPAIGTLWETLVLINLRAHFPFHRFYFYRTSNGAEIDFIIEYGNRLLAIECKSSLSPKINKGSLFCMEDLKIEKMLIIAPVKESWRMKENIWVMALSDALEQIEVFYSLS